MRDCSNGEVRDRLPELMHNRLTGETLAVVRSHVAGCAECRAELTLLDQLRSAAAPPRLDASHIVSKLPRYRAVPAWRRAMQSAHVRAAAAVVLLVGGYALVRTPGRAPETTQPATAQVQAVTTHELEIGDSFQDLTDSDLAAMVEEIGKLEAVTPEPVDEPLLPLHDVSVRSGGGA